MIEDVGIKILSKTSAVKGKEYIGIFPNPRVQKVSIELDDIISPPVTYHLTDLLGTPLMEGKVDHKSFVLDISQLRAGVYNIIISTAKGKLVSRLIKI